MAAAPADPTASPDTGDQEGGSITISWDGSGTFQISMGDDSDASPDDQADQPQQASSIDDALKIAGEMYQAEEQEEGAESPDGDDGNTQMAQPDAKAYWNQLASKKSKQSAPM